ncbi:hypothetical protein ZOSMA_148G00020 [Zostera marina]|uniref:Uncharacterized protein n=1 Tax=Zostera marina TaxID=29655 RepID=A0A0K9PWZ7_ZOSMR|nr:hypothetical protein ZOSMA_148G00020 [Zostera marina]
MGIFTMMNNLTKIWRRSSPVRESGGRDEGLPLRDDCLPMETQEQEKMVKYFEDKHAKDCRQWRGIFGGILVCYIGFLLYSIIHHVLNPWDLRYHAYFMEYVESSLVIFADILAVMCCIMSIKGLRHGSISYKKWFWYSCYISLFLATFWLYHMTKLPKFRWEIIWLPFGPLSGSGICLYVDHLLTESNKELQLLRNSMYEFKFK